MRHYPKRSFCAEKVLSSKKEKKRTFWATSRFSALLAAAARFCCSIHGNCSALHTQSQILQPCDTGLTRNFLLTFFFAGNFNCAAGLVNDIVMMAGGSPANGGYQPLRTTKVFNLRTGKFAEQAASLRTPRQAGSIVTLGRDYQLAVVGGVTTGARGCDTIETLDRRFEGRHWRPCADFRSLPFVAPGACQTDQHLFLAGGVDSKSMQVREKVILVIGK